MQTHNLGEIHSFELIRVTTFAVSIACWLHRVLILWSIRYGTCGKLDANIANKQDAEVHRFRQLFT